MHPLFWKTLALAAPACVNAMLRFSCSQLVVDRIDPLVQPGMNPSGHVHQIAGGNAFNVTMDPSLDLPAVSTCTSCTFSEDHSNYWTANLYYRSRSGTLTRVPQMANQFLDGANGGLTVYYIQPYDGSKVKAFAPGFRMLVGSPMVRGPTNTDEARQSSFRCFQQNFGGNNAPPGGGSDTRDLPKKPCPGGIRSNLFFPTCWDGVNVDSPDHKSHVAFPVGGTFETNAPCPKSHPVKLPQLFYEIVWDTRQFNNQNDWPVDGSQPFVFSFGDTTGYGQHGDYIFGWKGDSLQRAMDQQCNVACGTLKSQDVNTANRCTIPRRVNEEINQGLTKLPGNNPITH